MEVNEGERTFELNEDDAIRLVAASPKMARLLEAVRVLIEKAGVFEFTTQCDTSLFFELSDAYNNLEHGIWESKQKDG